VTRIIRPDIDLSGSIRYPVSGRKYPVVFPNIASENRVKIGPELAEKRVKVA
jgi:hypothetical protein